MALISTLYPKLRLHVSNCPEPVLLAAVVHAAREFCRDSRVLRESLVLDVIENEQVYTLAPATEDTEVCAVIAAQVGEYPIEPAQFEEVPQSSGKVVAYTYEPPDELWLHNIPSSCLLEGLGVRVVLQPTTDATALPEALIRRYSDPIVYGAIAWLKSQKDRSWADLGSVGYWEGRFKKELHHAKADADFGFRTRRLRTRTYS